MLAVLMVLSLAACGKTPAEPTQTPSTQPGTETPTTEATEPAPAYAIDTLTVGTTAAIETAVFGEYNFDMLASGVSGAASGLSGHQGRISSASGNLCYRGCRYLDLHHSGRHDLVRRRACNGGGHPFHAPIRSGQRQRQF